MNTLKISFLTLEGEFGFALSPITKESNEIFGSLLACFDKIGGNSSIVYEQQASTATKQKLIAFTDKFSRRFPYLNKVKKNILNLADDEYFLISPVIPDDYRDHLNLQIRLHQINSSNINALSPDTLQKDIIQFEDIIKNYDIFEYGANRSIKFGNADKLQRKCRFCGKICNHGATFKKVAHAIPEALGNKTLILHEECDECNEFFGNEIEPQLIEHFNIHRTVFGIKGKKGVPTIKYKNGEISYKDNMAMIKSLNVEKTPDGGVTLHLEPRKKTTPLKLYKALCKMSLSTIVSYNHEDFLQTAAWLRQEDSPFIQLPKVAKNVIKYGNPNEIRLINYIRKSDDTTLPHVVSQFRVGHLVYVFIIPFSKKDTLKFIDANEYEKSWERFKHYSILDNWDFEQLDSVDEITIPESISFFH